MPSTYLSVSVCYSVSEECLCVSISTLYDAGSKVVNDMMMLGFSAKSATCIQLVSRSPRICHTDGNTLSAGVLQG